MKEFFEHRDLITIVDSLCKKYGKLPHEVMFESTIYEFCFDIAVMAVGTIEENKIGENNPPSDKVDWSSMGIERVVKKKEQGD